MKKLLSISAIICFLATFSSCKRDYTCTCIFFSRDAEITQYNDTKRSSAEASCELLETGHQILDPTASCALD